MAVTGSIAHYDRATYVNRLLHAGDIRHLVVDAFGARHSIRPSGRETRPGVWLDDNARVHSRARIEGPAYIGRGTRVEATALIAGFSSVERNCHIDCGTVVADSSILAHSYLGAWLDVSHAVVCGSRVAHLRHNVTVDIQDDRLIRKTSVFQRVSPLFRDAPESAGDLRSPARTSKPQRSVIRAARALFLAKGAQ
jgi:NDP-sugar pyrophosphorylase family protein